MEMAQKYINERQRTQNTSAGMRDVTHRVLFSDQMALASESMNEFAIAFIMSGISDRIVHKR